MDKERRSHDRVRSSHLVTVFRSLTEGREGAEEVIGRTMDLSPGGILLETAGALTPGDRVVVSLALEECLVEVSGGVVRVRPVGEGFFETAITFDPLPAGMADKIVSFWSKHRGEAP